MGRPRMTTEEKALARVRANLAKCREQNRSLRIQVREVCRQAAEAGQVAAEGLGNFSKDVGQIRAKLEEEKKEGRRLLSVIQARCGEIKALRETVAALLKKARPNVAMEQVRRVAQKHYGGHYAIIQTDTGYKGGWGQLKGRNLEAINEHPTIESLIEKMLTEQATDAWW